MVGGISQQPADTPTKKPSKMKRTRAFVRGCFRAIIGCFGSGCKANGHHQDTNTEIEIAVIPPKSTNHEDNVAIAERGTQTTSSSDRIRVPAEGSEFPRSVETVAPPIVGIHIRIPSETVSIPESGTETTTTTTTDIVLDSEDTIQTTKATDNVSGLEIEAEVAKGTDIASEHSRTTPEGPAEDAPHLCTESVHPAQQALTFVGRCRSFFSRVRPFFYKNRTKYTSKGIKLAPPTVKSFTYHKILGEGVFGMVYLASHPAINQVLAVKMANKALVRPGRYLVERNANEALEGSRFSPHLYATFQTKESFFYIMEYINGETLEAFIARRRPLAMETIRFISAELLCGMQFIHSRGIKHSDLHAKNVLLDGTGHVKIIDFGSAAITENPFCLGTPITMPIEAWRKIFSEYSRDYTSYHTIVLSLASGHKLKGTNEDTRDLQDFLKECQHPSRDVRQNAFFRGIDWGGMEAGNIPPPYVMGNSPEIDRSKTIKVRPFKRTEYAPRSHVPEFDFVSDRWRPMP